MGRVLPGLLRKEEGPRLGQGRLAGGECPGAAMKDLTLRGLNQQKFSLALCSQTAEIQVSQGPAPVSSFRGGSFLPPASGGPRCPRHHPISASALI